MADTFFVLTGSPGSGKTSILDRLKDHNIACIPEPARRVIAEQRAIGGEGTSEQNPKLFIDLMLECSITDYQCVLTQKGPCLFDRGIPDLLAYSNFYDLETAHIKAAAKRYRYAPTVFFAPVWEEIFENDAERKLTFKQATEFDRRIRTAYEQMGYDLHILPFANAGTRAAHILRAMRSQ